jgi:predicted MFS family arabinose efflux permease
MSQTAIFRASPKKGPSALTVIVVGSLVVSLAMGLRQSLGLFLQPIRADLGVSASSFGFALAVQNLIWGLVQPFVGMLGDRYGARPVLFGCGLIYMAGLLLMACGGPLLGLGIGGGLLVGTGIAGCGFGVVLGTVSRAVPPEKRMQTVGLVSAAGSVATLFIAPLGQQLILAYGWQWALAAFAAIAGLMTAISLFIGPKTGDAAAPQANSGSGAKQALFEAIGHPGFVAMTIAFFACGFQLMYITTHLPAYLALCGVAPGVSATALGVIGLSNAFGSYAAGWLGARYSQKRLLALIYLLRTISIIAFLSMPVTGSSTIAFAAAMGFLWLSVAPLVSGLIGRMFGLQNFNMLFGVTFLSHQIGGFTGAWLGGLSFDLTGSYSAAWGSMIVIGLSAFILQWTMDDEPRPSTRPMDGLPTGEAARA